MTSDLSFVAVRSKGKKANRNARLRTVCWIGSLATQVHPEEYRGACPEHLLFWFADRSTRSKRKLASIK